jgi:hypothetical protein
MNTSPATLDSAFPAVERPLAPAKSVYVECIEEENRHKWIESEKAGYDLGEGCIHGWVRKHWHGYLRARWVEHLQGKCFWIELDRGDFGLLSRAFSADRDLLNAILEQLKAGQENLDVLCWAKRQLLPADSVVRILEALDINSRRLLYKFDQSQQAPPRQ